MRRAVLFILASLFVSTACFAEGPHETPAPERPQSPFERDTAESGNKAFAQYLNALPSWDKISADDTAKSALLEKVKTKLEPFTKDPFVSCFDNHVKQFSLEKTEDGIPTLRLKISRVEKNELKEDLLEYLLQPVGIRGDWMILADPEVLGESAWWAMRAVEKNGRLDLQIMRVDVKDGKAVASEIEYFEKTEQARCELEFATAFGKPGKTDPGLPTPFLSLPHSDGKHALSLVLTPAQKKTAEEFVKKNPAAIAVGPFLFSDDPKKNAEIQTMLATYNNFQWLESRKASIKDIPSYAKIEGFLRKHELLPPEKQRDATLLHLPYMAALDGVIAGHIPNAGNLPETLFVYHGSKAEKEALRRANLGDNLIYTRFPIDKMDKFAAPVLVHEYMHSLDENHFNYSLPMARAAIQKGLSARYDKIAPADSTPEEKTNWMYYNSPVEKVAYATEIAYLRDVENLDFQQCLSRINEMHMQHSDSRTAPDFLQKMMRQFYDEKDLKMMLQTIRAEANELSISR